MPRIAFATDVDQEVRLPRLEREVSLDGCLCTYCRPEMYKVSNTKRSDLQSYFRADRFESHLCTDAT